MFSRHIGAKKLGYNLTVVPPGNVQCPVESEARPCRGVGVFLLDMARVGDALLRVTAAHRINYEILGNSEPELHAHIFPRYRDEAEEKKRRPVWFYDWESASRYSEREHGALKEAIRQAILRGRGDTAIRQVTP